MLCSECFKGYCVFLIKTCYALKVLKDTFL